jgi:hypothetical protein
MLARHLTVVQIGVTKLPSCRFAIRHRAPRPKAGALRFSGYSMGCRCKERAEALRRAVAATARGDRNALGRELGFVGRTIVEDTRSGALARVAMQRLAVLRRR